MGTKEISTLCKDLQAHEVQIQGHPGKRSRTEGRRKVVMKL
jgi:hypothetical protein